MFAIDEYLKDLRESELFFKPNLGNAGDAMINLSAYQAFRRCGCKVRMVRADEDLSGKTVVYGGGGNLVKYYSTAADFLSQWHAKSARLIVLPSTISGNEGLIPQMGSNVDLICREKISYQYVKNLNTKANILLMDDMAFYLDISHMNIGSADPENLTSRQARKSFVRNLSKYLSSGIKPEPKILNAFRVDKESTDIIIPEDNIDVARLLITGDMAENKVVETVTLLLRFLDHYDEINTNRLHICISGFLLNKKVNFYPNSYYKNEAVYNFSMKDKGRMISWKG